MDKVQRHREISAYLSNLYETKNKDYGDSFAKSFDEYGMTMSCIRLEDKLNRLKALTVKNQSQQVKDESIEDTLMDLANYTLMDLANYAIMTVIELQIKEEKNHGEGK